MKKSIFLILVLLFGLVTLFASSSVIFDLFGMREKEGNYVLFIVWANFVCSILYFLAAFGIFKNKTWAKFPLIIALLILLIAFLELFLHIYNDGLYETKTIGAMAFRIAVTAIFLFITTKILKK